MNIEFDKDNAEDTKASFSEKSFMNVGFSQYNTPKFSETPGKDYINYGQDNMYPNYLIESLNKSGIHNAIIDSKCKQVFGDGIHVDDSSDTDQLGKVLALINKCNSDGESLNDVLRKTIFDFEVFGGFALNLIWSHDRTSIASISHIDFSSIRVPKPDEDGCINHYLISDNWKKAHTNAKYKPSPIAKFDLGNRIEPSTILYVKPYRANTLYYPIPSYIGAMNDVENDYQISNFQLNSVKNGLSPSMMINFNNGQPTKPEREEIYRTIQQSFAGSDQAGKFMLFFNQSKDSAAEVTPLDMGNLDKIYTVLRDSIVQSICTGHKVTSTALVGISTPGQLGTSQELLLASELFYNQVIGPDQLVIEETINKILLINGFSLKISLSDIQPVTFQISEQTMLAMMTKDEIRAKLGFKPLTDEQRSELGMAPAQASTAKSGGTTQPSATSAPAETNEALTGLSAKDNADLYRIIRDFNKGKLNEALALMRIMAYGISEDAAKKILGIIDETDETSATSNEPQPLND